MKADKDYWDKADIIMSVIASVATVGIFIIGYMSLLPIQKDVAGIEQQLNNITGASIPCDPYPVPGIITYNNKPVSTLIGIENVRTKERDFLMSNEFGEYIFALGNLPSCFRDKDEIKVISCFNQMCEIKSTFVNAKADVSENVNITLP
ncbi:MAG: hypothetical protein E4G94_10965 [ANME-2 cluster archaeon]|nr:MAG: hypothetical protein E4G94_10965 [ANME-2 cluster archaeon]